MYEKKQHTDLHRQTCALFFLSSANDREHLVISGKRQYNNFIGIIESEDSL